ncbi:ABC transporter substrate-binding protein [Vallitalea maricola]|uniref:Sugar ABC transporter substrate-binding protein n=1 Tax=Vallitalea maricola TaxID=3074433 RepID=A0ACB5UE42_9FIRM|nr:sugar ABC transporter substrate-binding protein [Vallitalea sp. AN17-2]
MTKKITMILLSMMLVVSLFSGCSSKDKTKDNVDNTTKNGQTGTNDEKEKAVTLKVAVWDKTKTQTFDELAAKFTEEYPNIKVEYIDISSTEYTNKLSIMLNGGSDLDVFYIKDADTTLSMYKKSQLNDLTSYINESKIDLSKYNGLADNFQFDDGIYGLPFRTDYYVLYYNKDVFDAAKEPYPTNDMTWDEYAEVAARITSGEGANKIYGALTHTWNACVQNWAVQEGKHTIISDDYSFMKPYYERALKMQNDDKSAMDYATLKTSNIHYSGPFLNGQVGMMPMGTWFMNTIILKKSQGETDINWGVATIPHDESIEAGYTVGATTPIAMNADSKNKDEAWKFMKFVTNEQAAAYLSTAGLLPGILTDEALGNVANAEGMPEGMAEALAVKNIQLDRPIAAHVLEVNKILGEEHGLIMFGESTIDEGLQKMQERVAEIMND